MKTREKKLFFPGLLAAIVLPTVLIALFYGLKDLQAVMNFWVFQMMAPLEQFLGRLWSVVPCFGMELMIGLFLMGNLVWLGRIVILTVRDRIVCEAS